MAHEKIVIFSFCIFWSYYSEYRRELVKTALIPERKGKSLWVGVHRNRYCKIRPEPELAGTDEKFRRELPAGTGTDFINRNRVNTLYKSSMF